MSIIEFLAARVYSEPGGDRAAVLGDRRPLSIQGDLGMRPFSQIDKKRQWRDRVRYWKRQGATDGRDRKQS